VIPLSCRLMALIIFIDLVFPRSLGAGSSVSGYVSHRISSCDYFLVHTNSGYDLLEWFGGYEPDKGDTLVGKYEEYGFHNVLDETTDETSNLYTEEYWLSKTDALEHLTDKCE
jgi:hypothetical protein